MSDDSHDYAILVMPTDNNVDLMKSHHQTI